MPTPKPYNKKMKGESEKMYHRYEVHRNQGPNRSYKKTAEILNKEITEKAENPSTHNRITENALMKTANRWFWNERCSLYDAENIYQEALQYDEDFQETNKKIIKLLKKVITFLQEKLESLFRNDDNYATTTQLKAIGDVMYILDKTIYNYRLSTGKSTDNKELHGDLAHNVNAIVQEETKLVYSKEVRERIQNITDEPDEETQKFLDTI